MRTRSSLRSGRAPAAAPGDAARADPDPPEGFAAVLAVSAARKAAPASRSARRVPMPKVREPRMPAILQAMPRRGRSRAPGRRPALLLRRPGKEPRAVERVPLGERLSGLLHEMETREAAIGGDARERDDLAVALL